MKRLLLYLFAIILFINLVKADPLPSNETVEFDWNNDNKPAQFILEPATEGVFKGSYTKLHIKIPGKPEYTLENQKVWDSYHYGDTSDNTWIYEANLIESDYFAFLPATKKDSFLFLFGYAYASSPGDLYIFALNKDGYPELIFKKQFELIKFEDINNDGVAELIGIPWFNNGLSYGSRYIPHLVYSFTKDNGHFKASLNLNLSEKYCTEHGYVWAGPDEISDQIVVYPPISNITKLMKTEDAYKLFKNQPPRDPEKEKAIAISLSDEGLAYYKAKKDDLAISKYEEALKHDQTPEIYYRYGNSLSNVGRLDEAIQAYQWALGDYDKSYLVLYNLACAYSKMKKSKAALKYLDLAIKNGYHYFDHIQNDADLIFLRSQPEWKDWWLNHFQKSI